MTVAAVLRAGVVAFAAATNVKFTPGPGLKKNEDGTYSRKLSKEYLESVGAGESTENPESGSAAKNLATTLLFVIAVVVYTNREALISAAKAAAPKLASPAQTAASPKRASTADEVVRVESSKGRRINAATQAEARAARLARFTGDGPARAEAAMEAALRSGEVGSPEVPKPKASPSPSAGPRIATLGTLSATNDESKPDEFFGGDSTNTQW